MVLFCHGFFFNFDIISLFFNEIIHHIQIVVLYILYFIKYCVSVYNHDMHSDK